MTKQPALVGFDLDRYLRNSKKVDLSGPAESTRRSLPHPGSNACACSRTTSTARSPGPRRDPARARGDAVAAAGASGL
ncbi:MAG TPA: hypothetical protein VFY37_13740 [Solirubrobacterales bacterium]|nr:hypothetical protein [Solirubrobacterales bacterium]